jgi:hypothetical protein
MLDGMNQDHFGLHVDEAAELSRIPMRPWELVLCGFGVLVAASWILVIALGHATYGLYLLFAEDCGTYDLFCELDGLGWLLPGMVLGVVAAITVTYVVVRRWRRRPPHRAVAWLAGVVLPVVVVFAAKMIWG